MPHVPDWRTCRMASSFWPCPCCVWPSMLISSAWQARPKTRKTVAGRCPMNHKLKLITTPEDGEHAPLPLPAGGARRQGLRQLRDAATGADGDTRAGWGCDLCAKEGLDAGTAMHGCRKCKWVCCKDCYTEAEGGLDKDGGSVDIRAWSSGAAAPLRTSMSSRQQVWYPCCLVRA